MKDQHTDLYLGLSADQLQEARSNLDRYFELAFEIAEQSAASAEGRFDIPVPGPTMEERSNTTLKH